MEQPRDRRGTRSAGTPALMRIAVVATVIASAMAVITKVGLA